MTTFRCSTASALALALCACHAGGTEDAQISNGMDAYELESAQEGGLNVMGVINANYPDPVELRAKLSAPLITPRQSEALSEVNRRAEIEKIKSDVRKLETGQMVERAQRDAAEAFRHK